MAWSHSEKNVGLPLSRIAIRHVRKSGHQADTFKLQKLFRPPLAILTGPCPIHQAHCDGQLMVVQCITRDHNVSNFYKEAPVKKITIFAMAFLFVFVGIQRVAQADEMKAAVEDMKGKANAKAQKGKGEAKAQMEEAKGNDMKGTMERAKGNTKAAGERIKGEAKELKAKTE